MPTDAGERLPFPKNSFPLPNFFVDRILPLVSAKYFAVLLFCWRLTIGWGKSRDFISLGRVQRGVGISRGCAVQALRFWEKVGLLRKTGRSGIRGTVEFEILTDYDPDALTSLVAELVKPLDQSKESTRTSLKRRAPLVQPVDPQKTRDKRQERNAAQPPTRNFSNRSPKPNPGKSSAERVQEDRKRAVTPEVVKLYEHYGVHVTSEQS